MTAFFANPLEIRRADREYRCDTASTRHQRRGVHDPSSRNTRLRQSFRAAHVEATVFLYAIIVTANRLRSARTFVGEPALRLDRRWRLLGAIERCGGAPSFADLAKLLRMRR